jgi:RHS repeat-associated protein
VQVTYAYTLSGRQRSITDANNNLTGNTYDGFDRLSSTIYPDLTTELLQYDANNNVTQKTTRSGQTISSSYDALNRVQTKTPQGEAAGTVTYGYDYSGRMLQATDGSSSMPYEIEYDTAGRANSFTDQLGRNTKVAYDGVGNQTEVVWPTGTSGTGSYSVTYQYDALNRMQYVHEGGADNLLAQYSWDALSRAQSIAYGDGTSDAYSQYDAGDNLQTLTQTYNGSNSSVTFNYAWLMDHQLNSAGVNNPLFQYVPQAGTVNYGAADADNGLTTAGGASMTYDGNHNLTYDGINTLNYDVENRMVQAENAAWGASTYLYDPLGQRKQKVVGVNTAMPVATDFVLAGGEEIADYYESSATWRLTVRGAGGLPLVTVVPAAGGSSEEIVYVHHDMKGSTVALTVPGGFGPAESYTYSDYGQPQSGSWLAYQYAGYRYDSETGLYYMPARYYSPALGRFLQSDPVGFRGGMNLYAYAGNDPLNLEDPMGLTPDGSYEQKYAITLSETIATPFMALVGGPSSMIVSATSKETSGICSCTGAGVGPSPQELAEMSQLAAQSLILPLDILDGNEAGAWRSAMLIISNQTLLAAQSGNSSLSIEDAEEKAALFNSISTPMGILTALFSQDANLGEGASLANAAFNAQNELSEMAEHGGSAASATAMSAELYSLMIDEIQIGAHHLCPQ